MGQLNYTITEIQRLLDFVFSREPIAILGNSNNTNISLDGSGTAVAITNYQLSKTNGDITINAVNGTITINKAGWYKFVLFIAVTEDAAQKDWEFELIADVNGVQYAIDTQYSDTNKINYISISTVFSRELDINDVVKMTIASIGKAVIVDVSNSTFELHKIL